MKLRLCAVAIASALLTSGMPNRAFAQPIVQSPPAPAAESKPSSDGAAAAAPGAEDSASFGKPFEGKLQIRLLDGPLTDVPGSSAVDGDYLLQNKQISVVINGPAHASGNAVSGGYIIDGYLNRRPGDRIGQLHLYLNDHFPRMARFGNARIVADGSTTNAVALLVTGKDSEETSIDIETTYTLRADSDFVEIETSITPNQKPLTQFKLGDAFAWGPSQQYAPGMGLDLERRFQSVWIGGRGKGVAYGYFSPDTPNLSGPSGSTWIDINVAEANLQPGQTAVFRRNFVVTSDLAGVAASYLRSLGKPAATVIGTVTEAESKRPASGVRITAMRDGKPYTEAVSQNGTFEFLLPPGSYAFNATDTIRSVLTQPITISLAPGASPQKLDFQVSSPGILDFQIQDADSGQPLPSRVRIFGKNGSPDPDLGPDNETRCRNMLYIQKGTLRAPIPDGSYDLVLSRGIEYDMTTIPVTVERNREAPVHVKLKRAVKPEGMVSADFHLHMKNSSDSAVALEDRVISCVGEGLELLVSTDHNFITDLAPIVTKLGYDQWVKSIVGNEVTTRKHFFGHFICFPLIADTNKPLNGASVFEKTTAAELIADATKATGEQVMQVNHPRAGDIGYFYRAAVSEADGFTTHSNWCDKFTAIEVFNGKRVEQAQPVMNDWFNLLNIGYRFTATGNSDSHKVFDAEPGYPRNYVILPGQAATGKSYSPADIVKAVNEEHSLLVSNGPMIRVTGPQGAGIGKQVTLPSGRAEFKVRIEGANFVQPNSVELVANGKVVQSVPIPETPAPLKWEGVLGDEPGKDTWYVIVVRGTHSMFPIVTPEKIDGVEHQLTPLAFINPIWIDRDGDGKFTAINQGKFAEMHMDRSAEAKSQLESLTIRSQERDQFRKAGAKKPGES